MEKAVVQGVGVEDLKKGPGHYPNTPMPGQEGNAAIAGHRTTYGAPFYNLDELKADDKILDHDTAGQLPIRRDGDEDRATERRRASSTRPTTTGSR